MKPEIVKYIERKIKKLNQLKENARLFETKQDILTMNLENVLKWSGNTKIIIPASFIYETNNIEQSRSLYVFDVFGLKETKKYPSSMDEEDYEEFLFIIETFLNRFALSLDLEMLPEQRLSFDGCVRTQEENTYPLKRIEDFTIWEKIITRLLFQHVSEEVAEYLASENRVVLQRVTSEVMQQTNNQKCSDTKLKELIESSLHNQGINLCLLAQVDWEKYEHFKIKKYSK